MKVKVTSEVAVDKVGHSGLKGKEIVSEADNAGYQCYDVSLEKGENHRVRSGFGTGNFNHIYYCISGEVDFDCSDGTHVILKADHLIALTSSMQAFVSANQNSRLFIVYLAQLATEPRPHVARYVKLDELVGTNRDIDWRKGHSRRFLLKDDGFDITITNTSLYKGAVAPMEYKNHIETVYYIQGDLKYTWNDGKDCQAFKQESQEGGDGMALTMDQHDAHTACGGESDSVTICVFMPALQGAETYSASGDSSY